jgi:hypothetical protein
MIPDSVVSHVEVTDGIDNTNALSVLCVRLRLVEDCRNVHVAMVLALHAVVLVIVQTAVIGRDFTVDIVTLQAIPKAGLVVC